jgi:hypothetical protein
LTFAWGAFSLEVDVEALRSACSGAASNLDMVGCDAMCVCVLSKRRMNERRGE